MANAHTNKVVLGNETLIDLTADTVNQASLLSGKTAHDKSGSAITGNYVPYMEVLNRSIPVASWVPDSTYSDFPFKAAVSVSGVSSDMFAYVEFGSDEAESLMFSAECITYSGGVYVFADVVPLSNTAISKITFYKRG